MFHVPRESIFLPFEVFAPKSFMFWTGRGRRGRSNNFLCGVCHEGFVTHLLVRFLNKNE